MTLPPIPPSDSLYKFTAIGGLILVVLSLYVPSQMAVQLMIELFDVKLELQKLEIETQDLERRSQLTGKDLAELEKDVLTLEEESDTKKKKPPSSSSLQRLKRIQDLKREIKGNASDTRRLKLLSVEADNAIEKKEFLAEQTIKLLWLSLATLALGCLMASFGFYNWYYKFQVYQDRIIKSQSEQLAAPRLKNEQEEIPG